MSETQICRITRRDTGSQPAVRSSRPAGAPTLVGEETIVGETVALGVETGLCVAVDCGLLPDAAGVLPQADTIASDASPNPPPMWGRRRIRDLPAVMAT